MADIPPVSDPQLAALIQQNSARRKRAVLIFVAVAVVLGVGLGGSAFYSSAQAKKKRNLAYSRVVKCLFGKPLDSGEAPMTRVRAAWRARILAEPKKDGDGPDTMEDQEAAKAKMWPNRCVTEMVAFTDTLKEIGEMKEGEKDLGFYSRDLSKQTAGDNWKNVDTYQASVEAFVNEAQKGNFEFADADVQAPELLEAEPIDAIFPKSTLLEGSHVDAGSQETVAGSTIHFFLRAGKGKPARLCTSTDGKTLTCGEVIKGGLPPEASSAPWMLGSEDGAPALLAFGSEGIASGASIASGVFRAGDGLRLVKPNEYYVAGGYAHADGSAYLLLKDAGKPSGDRFKLGRLAPNASDLKITDVTLPDWNGEPSYVALLGNHIVWVDTNNVVKNKTIDATSDGVVTTIATLPGLARRYRKTDPMIACQTKAGLAIAVPTEADDASRALVAFATDTPPGFGKPEVVEPGSMSCGEDALYIVSAGTLVTCKPDGCKSEPLETGRGAAVAVDGVVVRTVVKSGLMRVTWERGGKVTATKIYDAQMKGTVLLGESKLSYVNLVARRGYALMIAEIGEGQHFARVDPAGTVAPVVIKEN